MLTRRRSLRAYAAILIATALLASSFTSTIAAVANVGVGGGWDSSLLNQAGVTGATPTKVSPGKVAGFYLVAKNNDTANLSSFFLTASTTATPKGAFWGPSTTGPWTACDTSNGLKCDFGAFNSGATVYVLAAFTLPTGTSTSTTNCKTDPNRKTQPANSYGVDPHDATSWVCVDFQFGSNSGYVPGKNNSRGDAYHWYDFVGTDTGQDSAAQFPFCNLADPTAGCDASLLTLTDNQSLGKNNLQWTKVKVPGLAAVFNSDHATTGIGVADKVSFTCPTTAFPTECSTPFIGEWSSVDVNSGQELLDGTPWITIDIGTYGISASKISTVYHFYQIGSTWYVEVIGTKCTDSSGPATNFNVDQCFWVQSLKGNSSQITVWTHHNGKLNYG